MLLVRVGLVDKWIERNGRAATYRALAKCLFEAGAVDSVDTLCTQFGATATPTVVPDRGRHGVHAVKDILKNSKSPSVLLTLYSSVASAF